MKEKLFGTKEFYRKTMVIALPIMIQNGITNFVGMLDNIMIGRIGTDQMTGVSIVNGLLFVWNLCVFGALAGIGIFTAQFYGKGDHKGIRDTMRLMLWTMLLLVLCGFGILFFGGDALIRLYLHADAGIGDPEQTFLFARQYLGVMYLNLIPFALSQRYATTLRSTGETLLPMKAGLLAIVINLGGNYILIFGKFGAPALGVAGAAYATVLSRVVEYLFIMLSARRNIARFSFLNGLYKTLRVPKDLIRQCLRKSTPLLFNEALWSGAQAVLAQSYSLRGLSVVAAMNISQAIGNVFLISFIALGDAVCIITGQQLGAGKTEAARADAPKHLTFCTPTGLVTGLLLFACSPFFPQIYNTSQDVRHLAGSFIRVAACCMPVHAFLAGCYFIMRSGGKTLITLLFDAVYCWGVSIPVAYLLIYISGGAVPIVFVYLGVLLSDLPKCFLGLVLIRRGNWANNIVLFRDD